MAAFAVLTAAGSGTRLGCSGPKALVDVAGIPMVVRAARGLVDAGITGIVITAPSDRLDDFTRLFPAAALNGVPVRVVAGSSASRQASVALGMAQLPQLAVDTGDDLDATTPVLVHDAARCLTPTSVIRRVVDAVESGLVAVIPALPVTDTLKEVGTPRTVSDIRIRPVLATPDRLTMVAVQTPQGFAWSILKKAHAAAEVRSASESTAATDDAGLVEDLGEEVVVVDGDALCLKITTALDLGLAEHLVANTERAGA